MMILKHEEKKPEIGDYDFKVKFAWFPKTIDNGVVIWWEKYKEVYEYRMKDRHIFLGVQAFLIKDSKSWDLIATQRMGNAK